MSIQPAAGNVPARHSLLCRRGGRRGAAVRPARWQPGSAVCGSGRHRWVAWGHSTATWLAVAAAPACLHLPAGNPTQNSHHCCCLWCCYLQLAAFTSIPSCRCWPPLLGSGATRWRQQMMSQIPVQHQIAVESSRRRAAAAVAAIPAAAATVRARADGRPAPACRHWKTCCRCGGVLRRCPRQ